MRISLPGQANSRAPRQSSLRFGVIRTLTRPRTKLGFRTALSAICDVANRKRNGHFRTLSRVRCLEQQPAIMPQLRRPSHGELPCELPPPPGTRDPGLLRQSYSVTLDGEVGMNVRPVHPRPGLTAKLRAASAALFGGRCSRALWASTLVRPCWNSLLKQPTEPLFTA